MDKMSTSVRVRLSAMMFLQFMLIAVFWVPLAGYLTNTLKFTVGQMTFIMSTMAFGCLLSPIIGMIADRHFASQKVLAVLNLLSAVMLAIAAFQTSATGMFVALLLQQLCYMPTWGLTSSIAMTHSPAEKFPQVRAFGSFGWVAAAIFSLIGAWFFKMANFDATNAPLLCAAGTSLVGALLALGLPHTPPPAKGQKSSIVDVLGLRAAPLMKQFDFAAFIIISTLVMIPFMIYFNLNSMFLQDQGFRFITLTMNLGQLGEIFFMLLIPLALARMGVKWAMMLGLITMVIRYTVFWFGAVSDTTALYYVAIVIHGIIFGFFFVGGQIYVDKKARKEIRAQAQGFLFLITFGIGALLSMQINNRLIAAYSSTGLAVPEKFALAEGASPTGALTIKGANLEEVSLYGRALNDAEVGILAADEKKAKNIRAEARKDNVTIDLEKDALAAKGNLADLLTQKLPKAFTFDAKLVLPKDDPDSKDDDELTGTIFATGTGDNALTLGVEKNLLYLKAGDQQISARRIVLPRDEDEAKSIRVSASFDGKEIKLYTDGAVFVMRDWRPIWGITAICSVGVLVLFFLCFHYKDEKTEAEAEAPAGEPAEADGAAETAAEGEAPPAGDEGGAE